MGGVGPDQELGKDLAQTRPERGRGDPGVVAGPVLGEGKGDQRQAAQPDEPDGDLY